MKKIILALFLSLTAVAQAAQVDELVVPYSPGGVVSAFGQVVQKYLTEDFNKNTVLVNKGGADGKIGVRYVLESATVIVTYGLWLVPAHSCLII